MGMAVARQLCREGHDLTLVDKRQDKVDNAVNSLDVIGCRGSCAAPETLSEAEAGLADLFIAATGVDEANLIACQLARRMGAKHAVSLLRNPDYVQNAEMLKETMHLSFSIHPDFVAAEEISRVLQFPAAIRVESFPDCDMEIVTFRIEENSRLIDVPLVERKVRPKWWMAHGIALAVGIGAPYVILFLLLLCNKLFNNVVLTYLFFLNLELIHEHKNFG